MRPLPLRGRETILKRNVNLHHLVTLHPLDHRYYCGSPCPSPFFDPLQIDLRFIWGPTRLRVGSVLLPAPAATRFIQRGVFALVGCLSVTATWRPFHPACSACVPVRPPILHFAIRRPSPSPGSSTPLLEVRFLRFRSTPRSSSRGVSFQSLANPRKNFVRGLQCRGRRSTAGRFASKVVGVCHPLPLDVPVRPAIPAPRNSRCVSISIHRRVREIVEWSGVRSSNRPQKTARSATNLQAQRPRCIDPLEISNQEAHRSKPPDQAMAASRGR